MFYRHAFSIGTLMIAAAFAGLTATSGQPAWAGDKKFRPTVEADMPEDFPSYTPVGKVRIKEYPAYRESWPTTVRSFLGIRTTSKSRSLFNRSSAMSRAKATPYDRLSSAGRSSNAVTGLKP